MTTDESVKAGPETVIRRRGQLTPQQRRRIVADSRVAGASVQDVADRHGVRANIMSAWRRQDASRAEKAVEFSAVRVSAAPADGSNEQLVAGCVRVRGIVDGTMLREVLVAAR